MTGSKLPHVEIATNAIAGELAAWRQAIDILAEALPDDCRFSLTTHASPESALRSTAPVIGLSLLGELAGETPVADLEAAWLGGWAPIPAGRMVFVCTLLRHLPLDQASRMARLRRLNLLAARLSQRFGLLVIDIDRALAHRGALALQTDATLPGAPGQTAAARLIAGTVLAYGLAGHIEDDQLDAAISTHEATMAEAIDRLSVPADLVPRQRTSVGGRIQVHLTGRPAFDERGVLGLLRDLRRGRIGPDAVAVQIGRKIRTRFPTKFRPFSKDDGT